MTRLIDVEEVCKEIDRFKGYLDEDMICRLKIAVKRLPIVEVIPISWIDSYITDSEIGITANNPVNIKMMVEDWDEENFQETAREERYKKDEEDEIN